jgi:uncharacterized protein
MVLSAAEARQLFLHSQGLGHDPEALPPATPAAVAKLIERIGFVQVDTISTVERAHHLILAARLNAYRPALLARLLELQPRRLFEHWTHDASVIPLAFYPHWRPRFERHAAGGRWHRQMLGDDADRVLAEVIGRITEEGPLASRDFEHVGPKRDAAWWGWRPHKLALDRLWRSGVLHVVGRRNFQKVYNLTERAIPAHAALPRPTDEEHVEWACRTALDRLGTASAREVAQFWAAIPVAQAKSWLTRAAAAGEVLEVSVESADGSPARHGYAPMDLAARLRRAPAPPDYVRLLCPFDPVLRDRARAKRLFNFDFRFEGFVPKSKRLHGYYVMAALEGDRFIAKADVKFDRASGVLRVPKVWWERGERVTRKRRAALERGAERLADWVGATVTELSL